jgi:hypothetical protein
VLLYGAVVAGCRAGYKLTWKIRAKPGHEVTAADGQVAPVGGMGVNDIMMMMVMMMMMMMMMPSFTASTHNNNNNSTDVTPTLHVFRFNL